jgi:hypothetical protein
MNVEFTATLEQSGKTATGVRVPDAVLESLGGGKRPRVVVTFDGGYSFRTTVGPHAGAFYIPVSAAVRQAPTFPWKRCSIVNWKA